MIIHVYCCSKIITAFREDDGELLESVLMGLPNCTVVGQLDFRNLTVREREYTKWDYMEMFPETSQAGENLCGIINLSICLDYEE